MVSLGDTAISLHILQPLYWGWGVLEKVGFELRVENWSLEILGGVCSGKSKPKVPRSALNFHLGGGGTVFWKRFGFELREENWSLEIWGGGLESQNPKVPRSA